MTKIIHPLNILHVLNYSEFPFEDWLIYRWWKIGDISLAVYGFGRTKEEALKDYEKELREVMNDSAYLRQNRV